ncbi:MAG: patatin-like phospholipase family protein [Bacteroidales bacterium]|nr:patatin-like phospholipase family protein [Bacteroidales bacterium]
MEKNVALVLSGGGPRGFAYIGAIEELESRGYRITSIAGTSIGSLIGGVYAAGKLDDVKQWLYSLDVWNMFSLIDFSLSMNHLVKGDRIISALKDIVPQINIEDLNIPYKAVATNLYTGEEVVFSSGDLFSAIRASISIPTLFKPVEYNDSLLIDGAMSNCLPINRVERTPGDILVAFDVNDIQPERIRDILVQEKFAKRSDEEFRNQKKEEALDLWKDFGQTKDAYSLGDRIKYFGGKGIDLLKEFVNYKDEYNQDKALDFAKSYMSVIDRAFSIMNHFNSEFSLKLNTPDILARMPFDAYGDIKDYAKAEEISKLGRELMAKALDEYE